MRIDAARHRRTRWRSIERKYGLTRHGYETIYVAQRACCAICELRVRLLFVDHDHASGYVRGLLCSNCNFAVGELRDDPRRCRSAGAYLDAWQAAQCRR